MDLSTLLAREGIEAGELDALVKWARQRATALVTGIEPGSAIAEALGAAFEHARNPGGTPVPRPTTPSAPRPIARAVSKPYLGAAVEAALSGKQEDLDLALETADAQADDLDLEMPVLEDSPPPKPAPVVAATPAPASAAVPAPPPASAAEPELDDNDPSIGGFNRFAFSFRRREAERAAAEESRSKITREFDHHAEDATMSGEWAGDALELPEPPTFVAKASSRRPNPGADPGDAEASGLLVLGIPDEEGIDIPVQRQRSSVRYADSRPFDSFTPAGAPETFARSEPAPQPAARELSRPQPAAEVHEMRPVLDDEDSFDLGLDNLETDAVDSKLAHPVSAPQASARADSGATHQASGPHAMHPTSGHRADSGPQAAGSRWEGPVAPAPPPPGTSPVSGSNKTVSVRSIPPPPPREVKVRGLGKPPPAPSSLKPIVLTERTGSNETVPAAEKRGTKRKKVVDLSQPVVRPHSGPQAAAGPLAAPSERSGQRPIPADDEVLANPRRAPVPDYLRDDDE